MSVTQVALIVVGCAFSALLTFIIFYLRDLKVSFQHMQESQDKKIRGVEGRLNEMPEKYVFRDDFVRWTIGIDKKIDDLARDIKSLMKEEERTCRK